MFRKAYVETLNCNYIETIRFELSEFICSENQAHYFMFWNCFERMFSYDNVLTVV